MNGRRITKYASTIPFSLCDLTSGPIMETKYDDGCEVGSHGTSGGLLTRYSASQPGTKRAARTEKDGEYPRDTEAYTECPRIPSV
jgi:hypothetical protein